MAQMDKWEKEHVKHVAKYEAEIRRIYEQAMAEAARIMSMATFDASKPLSFSDYPLIQTLMTKLQRKMAADIEAVITKGVDTEFGLSQEKAEELAQSVYSDVESALMELRKQAYILQRNKAREAFLTRKEAGLSLSDRVWRYTGQFKEELEMALDLGLRDGLSADELSREVRKYLNNPNMLFRRVRDEHGVLHLSKRAKAYHPGQGVYRSSYKNARRLTATETNMAYRTADYNAYQALSFVVGIRIMLSNNHTLNGEPFFDICDNLSAPNGSTATKGKGCYPKDFKFTGWHPLCRCFVQTIHKTKEELREDTRRMREGLPPLPPEQSANYVGDVPAEFEAWCRLNAGRVERAKSLPYFIKDNRGYYDSAFATKSPTPLQVAEQRHAQRTPEQAQAIRDRWMYRRMRRKEIEDNRKEYLNTVGEHLYFDDRRGGYVIADNERYAQRLKSNQERSKFDKERGMCEVLATYGKRVFMLKEDVRVSSPDILLDSKAAELKKLSSHNNIVKEAKDAIRKKNAEIVVFEFEQNTDAIWRELGKLRKLNIKCLVFFANDKTKYHFI